MYIYVYTHTLTFDFVASCGKIWHYESFLINISVNNKILIKTVMKLISMWSNEVPYHTTEL